MLKGLALFFVLLAAHCFTAKETAAQTTEFTYQGFLKDGSAAANGNFDFEFRLFNQVTGGVQIGSTLQRLNVPVVDGIITISLDYGAAAFNGQDRLIGIDFRPSGGGPFITLSPRQKVNSAPYSVKSLNSASADQATNAAQLGGVAAGQYVITTDPRMTDARNPLANSINYIQNTAAQQAASNFNIAGNGTAGGTLSGNAVNAAVQFNIGGNRIVSSPGTDNIFVGVSAGTANTGGLFNSFFGVGSGQNNTSGHSNSFFGRSAGFANIDGTFNSFFGLGAGVANTSGGSNSFFGVGAGDGTTTGSGNIFLGNAAGRTNTTGGNNTSIGVLAELGSGGLNNATVIGTRARVDCSNCMVLGSINGVNNATADTNVGIGTNSPQRRLHISSGSSGATSITSADLVVEDNAAAFQHFLTPNDSESGILFGDSVESIGGGIVFNNVVTNNGIMFRSGGNSTRMTLDGFGNLGIGTLAPLDKLEVVGSIRVTALGVGGPTPLCRNLSNQISSCSSSLRYKTNIGLYTDGLSLVNRLRPITFDWKAGGMKDVGFGAEDVAQIDPRLVTYNDKGEVEGVKYDRLSVAFVNAFKEQQDQIESLTQQVKSQQLENQALKAYVCSKDPEADFCRAGK